MRRTHGIAEVERDRYVYAERMRIAREVHDVVGHSLSVIHLQAGVALHVLEKRPEQVAASLEAIRLTSKDALAELRHTLGMFRDADGPDPTAPTGRTGPARRSGRAAPRRRADRSRYGSPAICGTGCRPPSTMRRTGSSRRR